MAIFTKLKVVINISTKGVYMRILASHYLDHISAGISMITEKGEILVTDNHPLNINGYIFRPNGRIYIGNWLRFDFTKDGDFYFDSPTGNLITASQLENGYRYRIQNNKQVNF